MKLAAALALGGAALLAVSLLRQHALPSPADLRPELRNEPVQVPTAAMPFQTTVGDVTYTVKPMAEYEIWGLVVSQHDSDAWWDYIHKDWKDRLNVVDLCVVYAENVSRGTYVGIDYSSGEFVCYFGSSSNEKWAKFSARALSNNHLLADRPRLAARLRTMQVGDQVHLRGWLANYSHDHGFAFHRETSLTRDDTGNGACEIIYVQDAEVLQAGGRPWRWLIWPAVLAILAGLVLWLRAPIRADRLA